MQNTLYSVFRHAGRTLFVQKDSTLTQADITHTQIKKNIKTFKHQTEKNKQTIKLSLTIRSQVPALNLMGQTPKSSQTGV